MAFTRLKILIAPMDWGWGHTTRCIPIAQTYYEAGHQIFFAGNADQIRLFEQACPFITPILIDGYNIVYAKKAAAFMWKMMLQLSKIKKVIRYEQQWMQEQMRIHLFDYIIADNRYGLYHPSAKSIIMTHQLRVATGHPLGNWVLVEQMKKMLNKFDACWVVDDDAQPLAGSLSTAIDLKIPLRYIGWLSQFQKHKLSPIHPWENKKYTLVVMSGPEPSRTQFHKLIYQQISTQKDQNFVVIGGKSGAVFPALAHVHQIDLADSDTLYQYLFHCEEVISRSGYTTVMDVLWMKKPCFFVPTPGQTEQIIIAQQLLLVQKIPFCEQQDFDLKKVKAQLPSWEFVSYLPSL